MLIDFHSHISHLLRNLLKFGSIIIREVAIACDEFKYGNLLTEIGLIATATMMKT